MGTPVALSQALSDPIPPSQYIGMGVYANDFLIWALLSHCRRLSQAPYPPCQDFICKYTYMHTCMHMQMISIFGHTCRTVAGFLRVYIPSCQSMGLGVYANGFHIWAHLSHCRRLSQAPYPHANTWAWVYMQMISIYGHSCRTVAGSLRSHTPIPIHRHGCICK